MIKSTMMEKEDGNSRNKKCKSLWMQAVDVFAIAVKRETVRLQSTSLTLLTYGAPLNQNEEGYQFFNFSLRSSMRGELSKSRLVSIIKKSFYFGMLQSSTSRFIKT